VRVSRNHQALENHFVSMVKVRRYIKRREHLINVMEKMYSAARPSQAC
jgi:hypothetical protein